MKLERSDLELETIVRRIRDNELDLQPDFQRDEIWDNPRRQRLVDTVLRNWYVPAIHLVIDSLGNEVVLDGQQRLAAIRDFFADEIRVNGRIEPRDDQIQALDGLTYSRLPDDVRRAVNRFVITVVTLDKYEPQEPNELFFRLNQSYNLTPPEKRNALHGEARDQVKDLVRTLVSADLLNKEHVGFSNGRLAYDDIISRSCVALEVGDMRLHINNNVVEDQYRRGPFSDETLELILNAGLTLKSQIDAAGSKVKFNKGTLQTWLIYCAWAPIESGALPPQLLRAFEEQRAIARMDADLVEVSRILGLYDDRASYRVTDVSSVRIRDLAIHLFSQHEFETPPKRNSEFLLEALRRPHRSTSVLVAQFLQESNWGDPIIESNVLR